MGVGDEKTRGSKRGNKAARKDDTAAQDGPEKIPVTIITGFLGSGKTTFVNHILQGDHGLKIAVIENEFGEVGVDDALLNLSSKEQIIEMNNGCVCCTVRGDLIRILLSLNKRAERFDHVIVETTGLADPAPVAQTFFVDDNIEAAYTLDAILTVVDAKHVLQHLDETKPEGVENESVEQIAFADKILLNKTDLVTAAELDTVLARIRAINAMAPVIKTQYSAAPLEEARGGEAPAARVGGMLLLQVLNIDAFDIARVCAMDEDFLKTDAEHQHDSSVTSVGIEIKSDLDLDKAQRWLSELLMEKGADIFRSKGVMAMKGHNAKFVFQGVHMLMSMAASEETLPMRTRSKKGDDDGGAVGLRPWAPGEPRVTRMVFIGRNLDRAALTASAMQCVAA